MLTRVNRVDSNDFSYLIWLAITGRDFTPTAATLMLLQRHLGARGEDVAGAVQSLNHHLVAELETAVICTQYRVQ